MPLRQKKKLERLKKNHKKVDLSHYPPLLDGLESYVRGNPEISSEERKLVERIADAIVRAAEMHAKNPELFSEAINKLGVKNFSMGVLAACYSVFRTWGNDAGIFWSSAALPDVIKQTSDWIVEAFRIPGNRGAGFHILDPVIDAKMKTISHYIRVISLSDVSRALLTNNPAEWNIVNENPKKLEEMGGLAYVEPTIPPTIHLPSAMQVGEISYEVFMDLIKKEKIYYRTADIRHLFFSMLAAHEKAHVIHGSFTINVDRFPWKLFGLEVKKKEKYGGRINSVVCEDKEGRTVIIEGWEDILKLVENPTLFSRVGNIVEDRRINERISGRIGVLLRGTFREMLSTDMGEELEKLHSKDPEVKKKILNVLTNFVFDEFAGYGKILYNDEFIEPEEAADRIVKRIEEVSDAGIADISRKFLDKVIDAMRVFESRKKKTSISDTIEPTMMIYKAILELSRSLNLKNELNKNLKNRARRTRRRKKKGQSGIGSSQQEGGADKQQGNSGKGEPTDVEDVLSDNGDVFRDFRDNRNKKYAPKFSEESNEAGKSEAEEDKEFDYVSNGILGGNGYANPLGDSYSVHFIKGGDEKITFRVERFRERRIRTRKIVSRRGKVTSKSLVNGAMEAVTGKAHPRWKEKRIKEQNSVLMFIAMDYSGSMGYDNIHLVLEAAARIKAMMNRLDEVRAFGFTTGRRDLVLNEAEITVNGNSADVKYSDISGGTPDVQAYLELVKYLKEETVGMKPISRNGRKFKKKILVLLGDFMGYQKDALDKVHLIAKRNGIITIGISVTDEIFPSAFDYSFRGINGSKLPVLIRKIYQIVSASIGQRRF